MLRRVFLQMATILLLLGGMAPGFAACPPNSEPYAETGQGNTTTVHCRCSPGFVRRGDACLSAKRLGVADPACMKRRGGELKIKLYGCMTDLSACMDDADIDAKLKQCAYGMFYNSAATAASIAIAPPTTPWVARISFANALTSCGFQFRAAEKAKAKCDRLLDACEGNLSYGRNLADECKK
jgi:hypothetical protein